ncbi:putative cytochrome P450 monooxygenase [Aspergillus campestris IBT 28561]|uniref:Cytochrome P450 monooxygenase n=1 Tax=Aspergillus campestris (strain IBT 28561) TaxID=1392248 RepID=A0A2I1CSA7_ASPC2|nr:putative cytochrome P450 monooxygenase [Aspergillus campestris IBT 28561]PKY00503.1 putative cytochrome P450 monooxygenase [Aspergillus campestris IBT 28561]
MIWTTAILCLLVWSTLSFIQKLHRNVRIAQRIGLPYVVFPLKGTGTIVPILVTTKWARYIVDQCLPGWLADAFNDNTFDKRWTVKNRQFKRRGSVHLVVNPDGVMCHVGDAEVAADVFNARQDFPKPTWMYDVLGLYGPNLVTCKDTEWARHRRHTATAFNEKNNALVWTQSIRQTTEMIEHWRECTSAVDESNDTMMVRTSREDILKFTLNIFSSAGFGVHMPFKPVPQKTATAPDDIFKDTVPPAPGFSLTFRGVVAYMNTHLKAILAAHMILPAWMPRALVPFFKQEFAAHRDLGAYLHKLVDRGEAARVVGDRESKSDLLQGMLAARDHARNAGPAETGSKDVGFSDSEVVGNAFIFTLAGHETVATTLRYTLVLLALNQDAQEWLYKGIVEATQGASSDPASWDYADMFPKLVAPLCIMLETMRLYPPVTSIPKWTGATPSRLVHGDKSYVLPPKVSVTLDANALHYSEEYWGNDVREFHPQRWDARNKDSFLAQNADLPGLSVPGLEFRSVHKPVRGAYIPFSDGFRACLGKKFAQVEYVVAVAVLFGRYRVELEDNTAKGRMDAERVLGESLTVLTLAMQETVPLRFVRR